MLKGVDQNRTDMLTEPAMVTGAPELCNCTFSSNRDFYSVSACAVVLNSRDWEYIFQPSSFWMSSRVFKFFRTIYPRISPSKNWRPEKPAARVIYI